MNPMRPGSLNILRPLVLILAMAGVLGAFAQNGFTIYGKLRVDGGSVDGCRVVVYRNGVKVHTVTDDLRKFSMPLDLNQNYILSFEKDGFVTKKLSFDTHAPASAVQGGLLPFDFVVSLFKQYDGVNTVVFNQPVGMIRYSAELGDFDYDTDYTKSIQSALKEVEDAVAKKKAEEHDNGGKAEKAKAEAARQQAQQAAEAERTAQAKAKADAEAAKQLAAKAKQEAEAKVTADAVRKSPPKPPVQPRPAPAKRETRPTVSAEVNRGSDQRNVAIPGNGVETSHVETANVHMGIEPRPKFASTSATPVRHKELIVEPNQVVVVVRVEEPQHTVEYKKVVRKYGGTYYFKDGISCTKLTYDSEALADAGQ
jgi:hypothetical protein